MSGDVSAIRTAVRSSALPVVLLRVADRCIVDVSDPVIRLFGTPREELVGHDVGEFIDELAGGGSSLGLVAAGAIDGYRRFQRSYLRPDGTTLTADVWLSAYSTPARTYAVAVVLPSDPGLLDAWDDTGSPDPLLAVGTVDGDWLINRMSSDLELILGYRAELILGASALAVVHPGDMSSLLAAIKHAASGPGGASLRLRLRAADGQWRVCRAIITPTPDVDPPPFGFAVTPVLEGSDSQPVELVDQLRLVARELTAAGVTAALSDVPSARALPLLARLSSRELEIVTRLSAGDRVPLIARSMFLGESTVRNHLTSVYRKLAVSSQQELVTLLRAATESQR